VLGFARQRGRPSPSSCPLQPGRRGPWRLLRVRGLRPLRYRGPPELPHLNPRGREAAVPLVLRLISGGGSPARSIRIWANEPFDSGIRLPARHKSRTSQAEPLYSGAGLPARSRASREGANVGRMGRDPSKIGTEHGAEPLGGVTRSGRLMSVARAWEAAGGSVKRLEITKMNGQRS
jgi:hypothetical protein